MIKKEAEDVQLFVICLNSASADCKSLIFCQLFFYLYAIFRHPQQIEILHTRFNFNQMVSVLIIALYMIAFLLLVTNNSGQNWILAVARKVLVSSMNLLNAILVIAGPLTSTIFLSLTSTTQVNHSLYVILMAFAVTLTFMIKIKKKVAPAD
ncbi:hypothetical protein [uncultured Lactobacillus sp.]|uniref:hypothetical protein n=1 Tax=uncultured Lactobacillus sp. TaxID=153152 RepID=UPI0025F365BC|nr:hypothetical protein [uncultured Lactobacillus sp.]